MKDSEGNRWDFTPPEHETPDKWSTQREILRVAILGVKGIQEQIIMPWVVARASDCPARADGLLMDGVAAGLLFAHETIHGGSRGN